MPIKTVIATERVPIKIWAQRETIEESAITQLTNVAQLPFVFHHVAAMPDLHLGIGATVGSVIATKGAISPACVGSDISCGMRATQLNVSADQLLDRLPELRHSLERSIPVGFESNHQLTESVEAWDGWAQWESLSYKSEGLLVRAKNQLGSLGGGNHFIELCLDTEHRPWIMLHSGSRYLGNKIAERHIDAAQQRLKQYLVALPDNDLAYVVEGTPEFDNYLRDVEFCQAYALQNRREMMRRILKDISYLLYRDDRPVPITQTIDCNHNYLAREHHFGEQVIVTRKGAVRARAGDMGIVPGSMGTKSYIVRGLGNPESFDSCSHGAGRRMSRGAARKQFTVDQLAEQTSGVECRKDAGVLDEIPSAYKDIDQIMMQQSDLVEIVHELKQVLCIKG